MRSATVARKTAETDVQLALSLEGGGAYDIATGCGFLDHMLSLFARHGRFDLRVACAGDTGVDDHHSVEDTGIALGEAFRLALGEKRGVTRYGACTLPMDEALALVAVDLSGRGLLCYEASLPTEKIGAFDSQLVKEFFAAFAREARVTLHVRMLAGENSHHMAEAMFKGFGRAMRQAVRIDPEHDGDVPSTKGTLGGGA